MINFAVLLTITKDQLEKAGSVDNAIKECMLPYKENETESKEQELEKYLEWNNLEAEYRSEYAGEKIFNVGHMQHFSTNMIPAIAKKYNLDLFQREKLELVTNVVDADELLKSFGVEEVDLKPSEIFESFEEYAHVVYGKDPDDDEPSKYGYWNNPNSKWKTYNIGGRWSSSLNRFTLKKVDGNMAYRHNLNIESMKSFAEEEAIKWWHNFVKISPYLDDQLKLNLSNGLLGIDEANFLLFGLKDVLFNIGWLKVKVPAINLTYAKEMLATLASITSNGELSYPEFYEIGNVKFETQELLKCAHGTKFNIDVHILGYLNTSMSKEECKMCIDGIYNADNTIEYLRSLDIDWELVFDDELENHMVIDKVIEKMCEPSLDSVLENKFLWGWRTYAVLNNDGWHASGDIKMMSVTNTPESIREYSAAFVEKFIENRDPDDLFVVIDCVSS